MYRLPYSWLRSNAFSLLVAGLAAFTIGGCPANNNEPVCGDNVVDETEECDDGNTVDGDGCSSTCQDERPAPPRCGDGVVNGTERCDDGNTVDGDGCSSTCQDETPVPPRCGDGIINLQAGEQCDDGNTADGDGCSSNCQNETPVPPNCGNEVLEGNEECDTGGESQTCNSDCTFSRCGDHIVNTQAGEQCDDGNTNAGDGCGATCLTEGDGGGGPRCGDGIRNGTEQCDTGGQSATCNLNCTTARCGDGIVNAHAGEQCDDRNTTDGDGCSSLCKNEAPPGICGDGIVSGTEECDGSGAETVFCNTNCTLSRCGDDILNAHSGEQCDDGNPTGCDGCSATCQNEILAHECCSDAIAVGDGTRTYTNVGANTDGPDEPATCNFENSTNVFADIWYCYTASCTGTAMASLCGSDYDTALAVYDGCGCPTAPPLACNDDGCGTGAGNVQSRVEFPVTTGLSYLLRVGGYVSDQGGGRLTIGCNVDGCASGSGDCLTPSPTGAPGCGDAACCDKTCDLDQFCCDVAWDETCAGEAEGVCDGNFLACAPGTGECGTADHTPGCDNLDCCNAVCAVDPYCCLEEWDENCVDGAASGCLLTCGPGAGDCHSAHATPGCESQACCNTVCEIDPFCCETEWDQTCVTSAEACP